MAYQTGSSTGPDDLLDKLRIWLNGLGWAVNLWATDNTMYTAWSGLIGTGKRLHVQKTATDSTVMYFNFRSVNRGIVFSDYYNSQNHTGIDKYYSEITGIGMYGSTGYNGSEEWDDQPGHPTNTNSECWGCAMTELSTTAIPAYYFFDEGDTITVCVEYESGKYQWFSFGCLAKEGVYTGGQFFAGSLSSYRPSYQLMHSSASEWQTMFFCRNASTYGCGAVYLDIDSSAGWRAEGSEGSMSGGFANTLEAPGLRPNEVNPNYNDYNTFITIFLTRSPNFYNSLAPFSPLYLFGRRASDNLSLLGIPEGIRAINPKYYDPAEEVALGGDTWMIFPAHCKDDADARMGFAVLK